MQDFKNFLSYRKNDKNSPSTSKLLFENLVAKIKEEVYR